MSDKIGKHYWVAGRVQGVWFRANTKKVADKFGVTGWVSNLADGRVEVMAYGSEQQISQLESWLQRGPDLARVDELKMEVLPWQECTGFEVKA